MPGKILGGTPLRPDGDEAQHETRTHGPSDIRDTVFRENEVN
jgi:hypothetical protein